LNKIKGGTHPGAIVLLHAVSRTNAEILGEVIDFWHDEGYKLGIFGTGEESDESSESDDSPNIENENSSG
jgi:peptidoglycan/xylan/chitin deacetylase (PgdA/CDA1 family)